MAAQEPKRDIFSGGDLRAGIVTNKSDFSREFALDKASRNLTTGINEGVGVRYGMSPIPGQSNKDIVVVGDLKGLRASEESGNEDEHFVNRQKFLGILPMAIGEYDKLENYINMFLWLVSDNKGGQQSALSAVPNSTYDGDLDIFKYQANCGYGFNNNLWAQVKYGTDLTNTGWNSPLIARIQSSSNATTLPEEWTRSLLEIDDNIFHAASAVLTVSGQMIPQQYLVGRALTNGTNTEAPDGNFLNFYLLNYATYHGGITPSFNYNNYCKNNRSLTFWSLASSDATYPAYIQTLYKKYLYSGFEVKDGTFLPSFNQDNSNSNYDFDGKSADIVEDGPTPTLPDSTKNVLMFDSENAVDSSYRMGFVAAKKPLAYAVQDWERDTKGRNVQIIDLTDTKVKPPCIDTICFDIDNPLDELYTENGVSFQTSFTTWPKFVPGVPLKKISEIITFENSQSGQVYQHVGLGEANTGILRKNMAYEFTYSLFDKQFGTETNVGIPVMFQTGEDDNVCISIYRDVRIENYPNYDRVVPACNILSVDPIMWNVFGAPGDHDPYEYNQVRWNNIEVRFYYRAEGTFDWLPALFIDAAALFFYPEFGTLLACQGDIASTPGGQPGGFNDYSPLPQDEYDCVLTFKNRVFWFSKTQGLFSMRNNPFCYPLRNRTPAPEGGFNGAIVHTYRGQSEQESRIVIFGKRETYIGKFTGVMQTMPVIVSPTAIGEFPLEGSDFNVETWTSNTSFSYRSAVVAEGTLFFWGPEGIFRDNGVDVPDRISTPIEPDIFNLYDKSKTDEIHAVYDDRAKEIIWFYTPKCCDQEYTHAIRLNVKTAQFFFDEYRCKIDWAQRIQTNNPGVTQTTNDLRTIIGVRKDANSQIQRGVFFDQINRAGDFGPDTELLVKQVEAGPTSDTRILTLDSGANGTELAKIIAGDRLTIQQMRSYCGIEECAMSNCDLIGQIASVDALNKKLTLKIPSNITLDPWTATDQRAFSQSGMRVKIPQASTAFTGA